VLSHQTIVKRILRYLVGTTNFGIWYRKCSSFDFVAYCDADYTGDKVERKKYQWILSVLRQALIGWSCRKQYNCTFHNKN